MRSSDSVQEISTELLPYMNTLKDDNILGIIELVTVKGKKGLKTVKAKFDTGTDRTCVDYDLAVEIGYCKNEVYLKY